MGAIAGSRVVHAVLFLVLTPRAWQVDRLEISCACRTWMRTLSLTG